MATLSIRDLCLNGKQVFMRVDFNVPIKNGLITDDMRIRASLPSIEYILKEGASLILCSHLGRPKGEPSPEFSLKPVVIRLQELLNREVLFVEALEDPLLKNRLKPGTLVLLENIRFYAGEEKNDPELSKALGTLGDYYVNDAFGTAHRAHSSTQGAAVYFKKRAAGFLMEKELLAFSKVLKNPTRPLLAIIGGAKISTKIGVLNNLIDRVDSMIIAGGMPFTFFAAMGKPIGISLFEADYVEEAKKIMAHAEERGVKLYFPLDHVIAEKLEGAEHISITEDEKVPDGFLGLDIGPKTIKEYTDIIKSSKTIIWNGPLGAFEFKPFDKGTMDICSVIAKSGITTVVGGGDTVSAVNQSGLADSFYHISTGGGASLELLEGITLPGVAVLDEYITDRSRKLIAANWKMNKMPHQALEFIDGLKDGIKGREVYSDMLLFPTYLCLRDAIDALQGSCIPVGSQNAFYKDSGAYTGEVSVAMLREYGCKYILIGHSERRQHFGEDDSFSTSSSRQCLIMA